MRAAIAAVALIGVAACASAQTLRAVDAQVIDEVSDLSSLYGGAYRVTPLADGAELVIASLSSDSDPRAIRGVYVQPNDSDLDRLLIASRSIPADQRGDGVFGQILDGTEPDADHLALTMAWRQRDQSVASGVAILRRAGTFWRPERFFRVSGAAHTIVTGPNGTLLVAMFDRSKAAEGTDLLTVYDLDGHVLGSGFRLPPGADGGLAIIRARIEHVSGATYAVYDPLSSTVTYLDIAVADGKASFTTRDSIVIPEGNIRGIHAHADRTVDVVTQGTDRQHPGATITTFAPDGRVIASRTADAPWNFVYWRGEELVALSVRLGGHYREFFETHR